MFYKSGIISDKQMFNFLNKHFTYSTMNSCNSRKSIANNVKIYNLGLSGDCWAALRFLEADEYRAINSMIEEWEYEHENYRVGFNGRSGGYLVLYNKKNNNNILPDEIVECVDYEEYKRYCRDYYGSVDRSGLVFYTKLVQAFDKLCDKLRDYCDYLSNCSSTIDEMKDK